MTAGIYGIPSFVIKDCANVFAFPLYILFDLIIKTNFQIYRKSLEYVPF